MTTFRDELEKIIDDHELRTGIDFGDEIDRESLKQAIIELVDREIIGEDEEIPVENRMSDPMQVREFNQLIKIVISKNATRQEQRQKLGVKNNE